MKRLLLILNPCSGKKRANRALAEIVRRALAVPCAAVFRPVILS